jgi:hypothetical protein
MVMALHEEVKFGPNTVFEKLSLSMQNHCNPGIKSKCLNVTYINIHYQVNTALLKDTADELQTF